MKTQVKFNVNEKEFSSFYDLKSSAGHETPAGIALAEDPTVTESDEETEAKPAESEVSSTAVLYTYIHYELTLSTV